MATDAHLVEPARAGKYVSFLLAGEEYAIEILRVHEINGVGPVAPMPWLPRFVRGISSKGHRVFPVICLRRKMGLDPVPDTEKTSLIVIQVTVEDRDYTMGLVVDEMAEVMRFEAENIEAPPAGSGAAPDDPVTGQGRLPHKVVKLLDPDKLFSG